MPTFHTYDPKNITISVGGNVIQGFADGSMVTIERNADAFTLQVGTDGEGTRSKSNNKSGRFTFSLMQTSDSNEILTGFALLDEASNSGVVPVMVKDVNGTSLHSAENAWVVKIPNSEYGREATVREWILETENLIHFVGGD